MLLLSRKQGEKIVLPNVNIEVTVLEIRGDRIRVGITAPETVIVHREELWLQSIKPPTSPPDRQ